jgi:hypothetical protein
MGAHSKRRVQGRHQMAMPMGARETAIGLTMATGGILDLFRAPSPDLGLAR